MQAFSDQLGLRCVLMRGGTSKGPFFLVEDLPPPGPFRDAALLRLMGALEPRRIDGIGGIDSLTNKVAIISRSTRPGVNVDYLFAQICVHKNTIDYSVNCGNMLAAVGPFAIDEGLVPASGASTEVAIFNVNTGKRIVATVCTSAGRAVYSGDAAIDGVAGTAAPVWLRFCDVAGAKTGKLLPTGNAVDRMEGLDVSCIDAAVPMAIVQAAALGMTGYETAEAINAQPELLARVERVRCAAGRAMGLGDVSRLEMPKLVTVAQARSGGTIAARYFMPYTCHTSFAVTGAVCLGAAVQVPGSVAAQIAGGAAKVAIEHPAGVLHVDVDAAQGAGGVEIRSASLLRTARRLFAGTVYFPASTLEASHTESVKEVHA
ncbi:MAG: 4-oxalomesaconate tautomerase [Pigmentiphaga sp.]|uniref:4-oxalomesaconate tautomerase n=1 Tax=Pigmentiphaga sp. TaxID=1977564 RepID=UPI0029B256A3|nr:4-oxalomesaconate tautomerase [Pigmentiphaga sp.]MDX3906765.1 4-oxalomesaconate tautomerase [Pigmentiphaga sp.]